jgi:hypothetical protein
MIIQHFTYGKIIVSGIPAVSLYNGNNLASGHLMMEADRQRHIDTFERELEAIEFNDAKTIYEMCFAKKQEEYLGPVAEKYGFKCVSRTSNPNTTSPIAVYIRFPA